MGNPHSHGCRRRMILALNSLTSTPDGAVPLRYKLFVVALMVAALTATITFEVFVRIT